MTFAPSVKCNGNVHIIDNAVIGMGAMVMRDAPSGTTLVGNPAHPLIRNQDA